MAIATAHRTSSTSGKARTQVPLSAHGWRGTGHTDARHQPRLSSRPVKLLSIAATWACNSRCRICGIWKRPASEPRFLDLERLRQALADPFFDGLAYINWFGGEPTLHPQLPDAVAWTRERFPAAHERAVVTNGYRVRPVLARLFDADPDLLVCFSLDGFAPRHEQRHGIPGGYDEVLRSLLFVKHTFPRRPRLSVTLMPGEVEGLEQVAQIAEYYDCEMALRPAVRGSYFLGQAEVGWTEAQIVELETLLARLPERARGNLEFTAAIPAFLRSGVHRDCTCKRFTGVIEPDATFRLCHSHDAALPIEQVPQRWERLVAAAEQQDCFQRECFIDGPYALSYLSPEHAPWLRS